MPKTPASDRRGFALESAIIFMVLLLALVGAAVSATVMIQRTGSTEYRGTRVQYAAEAGADNVMSQLQRYMQNGIITSSQLASVTAPTLAGFTYSTVTAQTVGSPVAATINQGQYAGLYGLNQRIDLNIEARDSLANRANVIVSVNAQSIPLFQFGVFYSGDLEIANGAALTFAGRIHTNGNLYLSSPGNPTNYMDVVTTALSMYRRRKYNSSGPDCGTCVYIANASGTLNQLNFDSSSQPTPSGFIAQSNALFDGRLRTSVFGVTPLKLPLPDGVPPIAITQPKYVTDSASAQAVKMSWKATVTVNVPLVASVTGLTQLVLCAAPTTLVTGITITTTDCNNIFSFKGDAFQDGREAVGVDALNIDVNQLMNVLVAKGQTSAIVYVRFLNPATDYFGAPSQYTTATTTAGNDYPAVRLVNAERLQIPFTLATDRAIYVQGSYNNQGTWQPSALMGDAITLLSKGWSDAAAPFPGAGNPAYNASSPPTYTTPTASASDTIYAAIEAGNSITLCDPTLAPPPGGCGGTNAYAYGGGLENFPRFLENWGGKTVMYRGSLVSLFQSWYASRHIWAWRNYYGAPIRDWAFDVRFRDPTQLPPGTPVVGNVSQIAFRPVY